MKKFFLTTFLFALASSNALAQDFIFSKDNYDDSVTFNKALHDLAEQILDSATHSALEANASNMMNLYLFTKQYEKAIPYLDSMRLDHEEDFNRGVDFPIEVFIKTKARQPQLAMNAFNYLYENEFREAYISMNAASQEIADRYVNVSLKDFDSSLTGLKSSYQQSDTLQFSSAMNLISIANYLNTYRPTHALMQKVIQAYDDRTYHIETKEVETEEGIKFRTHVVLPKGISGKLPTVFIFNIYADSLSDIGMAKYYASEGFASVVANTRGKGIDEHEIAPFEPDSKDAYELIDWISKQEWSDGQVGMVGGSYLGFAQWSAMKSLHPALKTSVPQVSVGPGIDYPMVGNIFMSYMLRWINYVNTNSRFAYYGFSNTDKWNALYENWYEKGEAFQSLDSLEGRPSAVFQRWLKHPSLDSFWTNMVPYQDEFSKIDIPLLTITGYFDDDQTGALYYHTQHHKYNPNANHYLVIGPYDHYGAQRYPGKKVSGYEVDPVAITVNFRSLSAEWFDYVLKGKSKPAFLKNKVNYQVMGANEWRHASTLSEISNDTLTFYFNNTKQEGHYTLSSQPNSGYLEQEVDLADRSDAQIYDFKILKDSLDEDLITAMSFISEPIEGSVSINGSFVSTLEAAINKRDFDVSIRTYELRPDGKFFALYTGPYGALQRASYARDRSQRHLLSPNQKETIRINSTHFTSRQLSKGSRLVVVLGVNKNPEWQINYGTGKDVSLETIEDAGDPLKVKWYRDSYIKFPIFRTGK